MDKRTASGDFVNVVSLFFVISLHLAGAQVYSATLNPRLSLELSRCRETCGDNYFECKIGKCEGKEFESGEGYGLCVDLCKDSFYTCLDDCKRRIVPPPTIAPTTKERDILPPGIYEKIRNLNTAKDISEFNLKFLRGPFDRNPVMVGDNVNEERPTDIVLVAGKDYVNKLNTEKPYSFTGFRT
ncbi:uncharacterized protein LOC132551023 [Ylistrum balloti]|uniref:uncharacterized protein LOC132551023 n=1 Tax=Ylistrum balloti TaxID=509963 RepID=UPI002905B63E|nr:uncharacterized protein LOC132551023 [Ylistrum balloti]